VDLGLGPHERLGRAVVFGDIDVDVGFEVVDRFEEGACQRLALQDREPALDLIEPGGACRRVVEGDERMARQPCFVVLVVLRLSRITSSRLPG
jgi:hypothetical protein